MPDQSADAIVIGAGPNGLVAANVLADAGWDVTVLEARPTPGGGVTSGDYLGPGHVADVCSAFYPLAVASPAIADLRLEEHGLEWCHAPAVLANPVPGRDPAVMWRDPARTAASVDAFAAGDGDAWQRLYRMFLRLSPALLEALFTPFPPVKAGLRLAGMLRAAGGLRFARFATLPVRRLGEEEFGGEGGRLLLAGCSQHTDLAPESAGSAIFGWLLAMLGQRFGFPVPRGGAGNLTAALVRRLESKGGRVLCDRPVRSVVVRDLRAAGVVTAAGEEFGARRAVLADVVAPQLFGGLVAWEHLPARTADDLRRFQWDHATVKVDWALSAPIPWSSPDVAAAGTVHIADSIDEMTQYSADIAQGAVPGRPFVLMGQMARTDPSRAPEGAEVAWGYTHVPRVVKRDAGDAGDAGITGRWDESERDALADRLEARIEEHAPGFRRLITRRHVMGPQELEGHDPSLVGGAINGGTSAIHQQLVFRPTPGMGRAETPIAGLYLASSSAHPGGGVHGACGSNAARAALKGATGVRRAVVSPGPARALRSLRRGARPAGPGS